jgi:hypothetical protein
MTHPVNQLCTYHRGADDLHEFTFRTGSREAVRAWLDRLEKIQLAGEWYGKDAVYVLLDARQAVDLPIRSLFECLSDYNREYPDLKPPSVRMAYLHHPDTIVLSIYYLFAELLDSSVTVEFFDDEREARAWLQSDTASQST